jgi:hypothetical protein
LAGLAVFALVRLLSAAQKPNRTGTEKWLLGTLIVSLGALLLSLRRSAPRYRW